jgi:GNAT superfamily N-acetyltransferase
MPTPSETLVEGLDRAWLEGQAEIDPIAHAWARWDLDHEPGRYRLVSLLRDGQTAGYLLVWYGGVVPHVHWVSTDPADGLLALGLPQRPVVAIVPERVATPVREKLEATKSFPLDTLVCEGRTLSPPDPRVRRLGSGDAPALADLVQRNPGRDTYGYVGLNASRVPVWGGFEGGRLVAVARIAVQLRAVWIIDGVFTDPEFRGRGLGREVTAAATAEALASGARAALYARADNTPAQTIYREVGYRPVDRRIWIDAGADLAP